ncbi:MAG: ADP-ribosylglycohydrolase family protein [Prolixibacteraceae bacterium]|nr:ADP-ribosylglycohydrolase family protein [Prolixibacteraceae bacterium]
MRKISLFTIFILMLMIGISCNHSKSGESSFFDKPLKITRAELADKIKGGWAGQVIGCTYGGPTEFHYLGEIIPDSFPIVWDSARIEWYYDHEPGLYDDVYMDLTFVEVFEKEGLDAPASSHAKAFANADYMLWHANQAARYNILNGIEPPASGYWENNPHSDDIDFQIEADFAGLMSPGMGNTASEFCDRLGHIMNYGDGWYGGVYVANMYALAFVSHDVNFIATQALKSIPEESEFYNCMKDVMNWQKQYPDDWTKTWLKVQEKWSNDVGCPDGVFQPFDIDAKINSAYILIGLLYGEGDYSKTLEISARCGQDSDCNPASAGGILGTMLGYSNIPPYWKQGLDKVEDRDFKYTTISLNDVYEMGLTHALQVIKSEGGKANEQIITIDVQHPQPVKLEQGFEGHYPVARLSLSEKDQNLTLNHTQISFEFEGIGFALNGYSNKEKHLDDTVQLVKVYIDNVETETVKLPTNFTIRRHDICWKYKLNKGKHTIKLQLLNPEKGYSVWLNKPIIYSDQPVNKEL